MQRTTLISQSGIFSQCFDRRKRLGHKYFFLGIGQNNAITTVRRSIPLDEMSLREIDFHQPIIRYILSQPPPKAKNITAKRISLHDIPNGFFIFKRVFFLRFRMNGLDKRKAREKKKEGEKKAKKHEEAFPFFEIVWCYSVCFEESKER